MAGEPFTMQHLCREAGASERTLQYAFQDHFGLSPRKFINIARLNTVRRALLVANPATNKVSDLAAHREYWHSGQFAADCRRLFGELPSETLRRSAP
jgi:AraC family ethanolamine operon transcriptional activator